MRYENPWLITATENEKDCKIRGSYQSNSYTTCARDIPIFSSEIRAEIYSLYMIKTLYAFVYGITDFCLKKNRAIENCIELFNRTNASVSALKDVVKDIQIPSNDMDKTGTLSPFNSILDGSSAYDVFNMRINQTGHVYYEKGYHFEQPSNISEDDILRDHNSDPTLVEINFYRKIGNNYNTEVHKLELERCKDRSSVIPEQKTNLLIAIYVLVVLVAVAIIVIIAILGKKKFIGL